MANPIPPKSVFDFGSQLLGEVAEEIDKQVGKELDSTDGNVSNEEVAQFLQQRGELSATSGAAVAAMQAYMRKVTGSSEVPITEMRATLAKVSDWVEKHRAKGKGMDELPTTWRALGLFAQEAQAKGLKAKDIVADRSKRSVGDVKQLARGAAVLGELYEGIRDGYGDGAFTVEAVRAYLADGSNAVATAKVAVRRMTRYLEQRTKKTSFSKSEWTKVLDEALTAFKKNADGPDDRSKLARTWKSIAAFADENAVRKKDAAALAHKEVSASAPAKKEETGPKATSVAGFLALDTDTKAGILEDYGDLMGHYVSSGEKDFEELPEGKLRDFAKAMKKELTSIVGDCEDDSGVYGMIGGPEVTVEIISLPSGEIVGGRVSMFQKGFNTEERSDDYEGDEDYDYHYDTKAEVEAAGFDPDEDISWSVHGLFQVNESGGAAQLGEYQHVSDYWEWSGY